MTETKWTPGPLKIAIGKYDVRVKSLDGRCTALTNDDWNSRPLSKTPGPLTIEVEEAIANAQLYAAAPDLYAALKMVSGMDLHHEVLAVVDAAMRKARGE